VQHSPRGSTVEVEVDAGRIVVRDRGPGLPEGPLFERFRRGEPERSGRPGFGLGLSLVRQWAELCGGSVAAHNDGGAVLTVRLPVAAPAGAEPAP
jgi:signal transduction histidine kinase